MPLLPQLMTVMTTFCLVLAFAVAQTVHGQTNQEKYDTAKLLFAEGVALAQAKSMQVAIPKFEQARLVYQEIKAQQEEAISLGWLGYINYSLGYKQKALDYFALSLPLRRAVGDKSGEAQTLNDIGKVYSDLGENQQALKYLNESLPLRRAVGDKSGEAYTLKNIGAVYFALGENQQALKFFTESLLPARAAGDKDVEAQTLTSIGAVYSQLGDKQRALKFYNESLPLARTVGNRDCEANTLHNIGVVYSNLGENRRALKFYDESLPLFRAVGDKSREGQTLKDIGAVYSQLGEKQQALKLYNDSLPLLRAAGDESGDATTLANIGVVYSGLGDNQQALNYLNQALPVFRKVGDKPGEASTLSSMGVIYSELGENQQALKYLNESLPLRHAVGDKRGEAQTLSQFGLVYSELGENQQALEFYREALLLYRATGDKRGEAGTLIGIGAVYSELGENQQALSYLNESLPLCREIGDKSGEASTLQNIGAVYFDLGEKQQALNYLNEALPLFRTVGSKRGEASILHNLFYLLGSGNPRFGVFYGKESVNNLQILRSNVQGLDKNIQQTFLKSIEKTYRELASGLLAQARFTEAQQVLNAFKDQQYFDFKSNIQAGPLALTVRESELLTTFNQRLDRIVAVIRQLDVYKRTIGEREPNNSETQQIQIFETDLKAAKEDYLAFLKQAEIDFTGSLSYKDNVGQIADTREMQTTLRDLQSQTGQKAVAIYTLEGTENYRALLITPDKIVAVSYPIKGVELRQKAVKFFGQLSEIDNQTNAPNFSKSEVQKTGKELYDIVFAPISLKLKELGLKPDVLMWSLDSALRYFPVAALYDGKQYIAERYRNVAFTRSNSERMLAPVSPKWIGSGFYNSKEYTVPVSGEMRRFYGLENAKTELEMIFEGPPKQGVIGGRFLSNEQFTKESLFTALKLKRPLVHIASHFQFEPGDASSSFLLLGDGTKLTIEDLKNTPDDLLDGVELLTLSACETGLQKERESDGREIDGFAELAQRKGAKAVLASLWKVDDESTSQLMTRFYQTRQANKITKVEALQRAQLSLIRSKNFSHPYYWAPFILIGNWR